MTDEDLANLADDIITAPGTIVGWVWRCPWSCDCSQPVIAIDVRDRTAVTVSRDPLWAGLFRRDGRRGAFDELHAVAVRLQAAHPVAHDMVEWR